MRRKYTMLVASIGLIFSMSSITSDTYAYELISLQNQLEVLQQTKEQLETNRTQLAKEVIETVSESTPLSVDSENQITEYYANKYIPKVGCSLIDELPVNSDLDYIEPKKVEPTPVISTKTTTTKPVNVEVKKEVEKTVEEKNKSTENSTSKKTETKGNVITLTSEERDWLERLVEAEAGGESYEGKVAVATVIANRVSSDKFPNTTLEVIQAGNGKIHQFSPLDDGRINTVTPSTETKQAVVEVFDNGTRNLPSETAYFLVSSIADTSWAGTTKQFITTIGNHSFYSVSDK